MCLTDHYDCLSHRCLWMIVLFSTLLSFSWLLLSRLGHQQNLFLLFLHGSHYHQLVINYISKKWRRTSGTTFACTTKVFFYIFFFVVVIIFIYTLWLQRQWSSTTLNTMETNWFWWFDKSNTTLSTVNWFFYMEAIACIARI